MSIADQHHGAGEFLQSIDDDWRELVQSIGGCGHDPKGLREPYEALVRATAYQQLTARAGDAIISRPKAALGGGGFPTPEVIVAANFDVLRPCGFSATKVATVRAIAQGALTGLVPDHGAAAAMGDDKLIERLTSIKGIGRWTVEMLLMYSLERPDVLPADDFGIREGYRALRRLSKQPTPKALRELSLAWSPHRTVAAWYLWRMPRQRGNVATPGIIAAGA